MIALHKSIRYVRIHVLVQFVRSMRLRMTFLALKMRDICESRATARSSQAVDYPIPEEDADEISRKGLAKNDHAAQRWVVLGLPKSEYRLPGGTWKVKTSGWRSSPSLWRKFIKTVDFVAKNDEVEVKVRQEAKIRKN